MRLARRLILLAIAATCLAIAAWQLAKSRSFQTFGELTSHVPVTQRLIALTFDDGPSPAGVEQVLSMLQERGARATGV